MSPDENEHRQQQSEGKSFPALAPDDSPALGKALLMRLASVVNGVIRFFSSMFNVLIVFAPVGMAVHMAHLPAGAIVAMNVIAIPPLAGFLSQGTESPSVHMNDTASAASMNLAFRSAVELIIFILALTSNHILIAQTSLVNALLVNLLLVLDICFLLGGRRFGEQMYNNTMTHMNAYVLARRVTSILVPTALYTLFSSKAADDCWETQVVRRTSVIFLLVYFLKLIVEFKHHMYGVGLKFGGQGGTVPDQATRYINASSQELWGSDSDGPPQSVDDARMFKRMLNRGEKARCSAGSNMDTDLDSVTPIAASTISASRDNNLAISQGSHIRLEDIGDVADFARQTQAERKRRLRNLQQHTRTLRQNAAAAQAKSAHQRHPTPDTKDTFLSSIFKAICSAFVIYWMDKWMGKGDASLCDKMCVAIGAALGTAMSKTMSKWSFADW